MKVLRTYTVKRNSSTNSQQRNRLSTKISPKCCTYCALRRLDFELRVAGIWHHVSNNQNMVTK